MTQYGDATVVQAGEAGVVVRGVIVGFGQSFTVGLDGGLAMALREGSKGKEGAIIYLNADILAVQARGTINDGPDRLHVYTIAVAVIGKGAPLAVGVDDISNMR